MPTSSSFHQRSRRGGAWAFLSPGGAEYSLAMAGIALASTATRKLFMGGNDLPLAEDAQHFAKWLNLHTTAGKAPGDRIAIAPEADHTVTGHLPGNGRLQPAGRNALQIKHPLLAEPLDRAAPGGAVNADVSDLHNPAFQFAVEMLQILETPPGQEVAFDVFDPRLDLALGLGPAGPAQPRDEAVVGGKIDKSRMKHAIGDNGAGIVIKKYPGTAAELGKSLRMSQKEHRLRSVG